MTNLVPPRMRRFGIHELLSPTSRLSIVPESSFQVGSTFGMTLRDLGEAYVPIMPPNTYVASEQSIAVLPRETARFYQDLILKPILPSQLMRYEHRIKLKDRGKEWNIAPMVPAYKLERPKLRGWKSYIHPEGMLYHSTTKNKITFTTDVDIYHESCSSNSAQDHNERIERIIEKIKSQLEVYFDVATDQCLEIVFDTTDYITWDYYVADNKTQHIMWLEPFSMDTQVHGGSQSLPHLRTMLTYEYYMHLSSFPHDKEIPQGVFAELKGILTWQLTDSMTSMESCVGYTKDELTMLLMLLDKMELGSDEVSAYCIASAARIRLRIEYERYFHYYGHPYARLSIGQSIYEEEEKKPLSSFAYLLSLGLFHIPLKRLEMLNTTFVDRSVQKIVFDRVVEQLTRNWREEIIYSAILLNAHIAYLAIPNIVSHFLNKEDSNNNGANPSNLNSLSIGEVAAFVSMMASLCSITLGLLLTKRLRNLQGQGINDIAGYLGSWWSEEHKMFKLALMFSLPYGMSMWGTVSFVVAIAYAAYVQIHLDPQSVFLVTVFCCALAASVWTIFEINSWRTLARSLAFWRWEKPSRAHYNPKAKIHKAFEKAASFVSRLANSMFPRNADKRSQSNGNMV